MKKFLVLLLLPLFLNADFKEEILDDLATAIECSDYSRGLDLVSKWSSTFHTDDVQSKICRSMLLIAEEKIDEAFEIYYEIKDLLEDNVNLEVKENYMKIFSTLENSASNLFEDRYDCKFFRSWKIRCVVGALLYTVGITIMPFNPTAGSTIISTAVVMLFDGTMGSIDEVDYINREKERKKTHVKI